MTIFLVISISLISFLAFRSRELSRKLILNPYDVVHGKEFYRVISHAFIHADMVHLLINMFVLYSFGRSVEQIFSELESAGVIKSALAHLVILSIIGIIASSLSTILKHRNDPSYNSLGASGLVSAVVFTHIFFQPMEKIYFYFYIPIPGIIFGILYLVYSSYMGKRQKDNINHEAHLWGAVIGFLYPIIMEPKLIRYFLDSINL